MLDLTKRRGTGASKRKPAAGTYDSVVLKVRWADDYPPEEAYEVIYQITSPQGQVFCHKEIFKNSAHNRRTAEFEDYLCDHGITELCDFVGHKEQLAFAYQKAFNGNTYFNIVKRDFIE